MRWPALVSLLMNGVSSDWVETRQTNHTSPQWRLSRTLRRRLPLPRMMMTGSWSLKSGRNPTKLYLTVLLYLLCFQIGGRRKHLTLWRWFLPLLSPRSGSSSSASSMQWVAPSSTSAWSFPQRRRKGCWKRTQHWWDSSIHNHHCDFWIAELRSAIPWNTNVSKWVSHNFVK